MIKKFVLSDSSGKKLGMVIFEFEDNVNQYQIDEVLKKCRCRPQDCSNYEKPYLVWKKAAGDPYHDSGIWRIYYDCHKVWVVDQLIDGDYKHVDSGFSLADAKRVVGERIKDKTLPPYHFNNCFGI